MTDSNARSLAKAFSYRVLGSAATALVVYLFSGNMPLSASVGGLDMVLKIVLYFIHERLWNHIPFGRPKRPEYEI
jgi:uncharacterized membrane protein